MNEKTSKKHGLISKNNTRMFVILAVAGVILSFSLVSSITLIKRMNYQAKVINERTKVQKQLKDNLSAVDSLLAAYKNFDSAAESVIGTSDSNSKIVLDALPSKYDFPALATSLENLLVTGGFSDINITGSDNEATAEQNSTTPKPIEIPFTISAKGTYANLQTLIGNLQRSIRPFKILKLDITASANADSMNFTISAVTYYQPEKNLDIPLKEVK
jgi:Tfp pilus assembly protein PilO